MTELIAELREEARCIFQVYSESTAATMYDAADLIERLQSESAKDGEALRNAGLILLKIVDETDEYQKRPESGDWGVECACCMGELFQCDRADIDTARTALARKATPPAGSTQIGEG